jgi:hypothetical protein
MDVSCATCDFLKHRVPVERIVIAQLMLFVSERPPPKAEY